MCYTTLAHICVTLHLHTCALVARETTLPPERGMRWCAGARQGARVTCVRRHQHSTQRAQPRKNTSSARCVCRSGPMHRLKGARRGFCRGG
ncbi:MAG: hypothetical protein J3K34DRAFT_410795 [Monoraphidium minutum]|nr:MAG: hypothetical protein J3K34DRAFT_410795 [Monoraphidium minutum]